MKLYEQTELLKAVLALAAADGKIASSERGVFESLAERIGVGSLSLNAMLERAHRDPDYRRDLFQTSMSNPEQAFELLVATARIDGDIAEQERELLVQVASALGIEGEKFGNIYQAGIARADSIRHKRGQKP